MKKFIFLIISLVTISLHGQGNCLAYPEDSGERKACELSYEAIKFPQGSKESQLIFDKAIAIGPKYAWAYYQKAIPYLKRGFLSEGLSLLDKAVSLEPLRHICYRAYWFWQYKNYELCIRDLEYFYSLPKAYDDFTPGGEKNMKIILSLAYAKTNNLKKAIKTLEDYIEKQKPTDNFGLSDHYTLGMLYVKNNEFEKAIPILEKQLISNQNFAEAHYFLGIAHKNMSNDIEALTQFNKALLVYNDKNRYQNINGGFPVFISDIEKEIEKLQ